MLLNRADIGGFHRVIGNQDMSIASDGDCGKNGSAKPWPLYDERISRLLWSFTVNGALTSELTTESHISKIIVAQ